jgi:hypothetical protein
VTEIFSGTQVIGIMGMAKNTGKTTTMNHLIKCFEGQRIALTSIGLDGEAIDQITYLPKPRIHVHQGMLLATAKACLSQADFTYDIIEEMPKKTALGQVLIIRATSDGHVLLAGPVTNRDLNTLVGRLMALGAEKILVDGAFDRKTFSGIALLDGIVLATGAAVSSDMETVIEKTKRVTDLYGFPKSLHEDESKDAPLAILKDGRWVTYPEKSPEYLKRIMSSLESPIHAIRLKKAITTQVANTLIESRNEHYDLIIDDPSKWVASNQSLKHFKALHVEVQVTRQIRLLMVTINPFSPKGASFDPMLFLKRSRQAIDHMVINVKMEDTL